MLFGAHVSVAGGYGKALDYALSVGCECMQIFAKSPRQWKGGPIKPDAAQEFVALRAAQGFGPVFTHTAYLINLSTTKEDLYEKSIEALADELTRASMLGADGVVTHVGNVPDGDRRQAARRVGEAIVRAFDLAGGDELRSPASAGEHRRRWIDVRIHVRGDRREHRCCGATCRASWNVSGHLSRLRLRLSSR